MSEIAAADVEDLYPLSPLQEGMLFQTALHPGSGVYVEQSVFTFAGEIDTRAMRKALDRVVARHSILRTGFFAEEFERPMQVVFRRVDVPWTEIDLRASSDADPLASLLAEDRRRGFVVEEAPLLRARVVRVPGGDTALVFSFHHLLLDGWSVGIVLGEVLAGYDAACAGASLPFRPAPPYRDYIGWIGAQDASEAQSFWKRYLAGFSEPTTIGIERSPSARGPLDVRQRQATLSPETSSALDAMTKALGLTLSTVTHAAWGLLLRAYGGGDDVVLGVTVSGRPPELHAVEERVGLFINTVPVRVRMHTHEPVHGFLRSLQRDSVEARRFEYTPLTDVHGLSDVPRESPLFETVVVFESFPLQEALHERKSTLVLRSIREAYQTSLPLALVVIPGPAVRLALSYDAGRFDDALAERVLEHLARLLASLATAPGDTPIGSLFALAADERARVLTQARGEAATALGTTLAGQFAGHAARSPEAVAVICGGERVTYGELLRRSMGVARELRGRGVGRDVLVGVCAERSVEMVVAVLGVVMAGGAYVPLDPSYPEERLEMMLEDARPRVVLAGRGLLEGVTGCERVELGGALGAAESGPGEVEASVVPAQLAYVLFTSGSTGRPKGVMVTHGGLSAYLGWASRAYGAEEGSGTTVHSPLAFDLTVTSLWLPLVSGKSVELLAEGAAADGVKHALLGRRDQTLVKITPAHLAVVTAELKESELPGLTRAFVIGGEALTYEAVAAWRRGAPGTRLINEYGPTETVVGCAVHEIGGGDAEAGPVPIGRPIAGAELYVLGGGMELMPVGVWGELYVGGAGVSRGYVGRPELTAARYVPSPFGPAGARLYRTGDRCRLGADGELEYGGRFDDQVKVRGYRIELGDVEAALTQHEGVREAAVIVREDEPGDRRLVAYVAARGDTTLSAGELRAHAERLLPAHMVPAAFVVLAALPLTPNGKLDRRALPVPTVDVAADGFVAPRTGVAEIIAGVWADVLGVPRVGATDDFLELGGHSILALQVITRVRRALQVDVPVGTLFEATRLDAFSDAVEAMLRASTGVSVPPLSRVSRDAPLPLSIAQERVWFLERLDPGGGAFNIPGALTLRGKLDTAALRRALAEIVRRHEVLRTGFQLDGDSPRQIVHPDAVLDVAVEDLSTLPDAERSRTAETTRRAFLARPFDLTKPPLLRARILRLAPDVHWLLYAVHHIVFDGWSQGVLIRELVTLYDAFVNGGASPLPELAVQYADFAAWQRTWLGEDELARQVAYWEDALAGRPAALTLPTNRPRPALQTHAGGSVKLEVPVELASALEVLGRTEGATMFMVLLAAFDVVLHRYAGQDDILVGTPIASRPHASLEDLVGIFLNTLVIRADVGNNPTFVELVARVREAALGAYAHQYAPFEKLAASAERDLGRSPIFQVMFVYQSAPRAAVSLPGLRLESYSPELSVKFDLDVGFTPMQSGAIEGQIHYNRDLFDASTITGLADRFTAVLRAAVADPEVRVDDIDWLRAEERETLVRGWARGPDATWAPETLVALVADEAARRPTATAVVAGDVAVSYGELVARAGSVARRLREAGVRTEARVALWADRSLESIVGMLGILQAGGAYVPIDPALPDARRAFVLEDAGVGIVVAAAGSRVPVDGVRVVEVGAEVGAEPAGLAPPPPDAAAYVIYTSGSTGKPKGVLVTHANAANLAHATARRFSLGETDRVLQFHSMSFDASVEEIFPAWSVGAAIVLSPSPRPPSPQELCTAIARDALSVVDLPTAYWHVWVATLDEGAMPPPPLRLVVLGGEAAQHERVAEWRARVRDDVSIINTYGPTETTVSATAHGPVKDGAAIVPIGRPLDGVLAYVLDGRFAPVPVGIPGELYLGGRGVARGYLGNPDLTADRFVPSPFDHGARLYRTGDLARWTRGGELEFLGRADRQIKLRGFRIELGEVEVALAAAPGVRDAAAVVREVGGASALVGYWVPRDASVSEDAVLTDLQARLPAYMVPTVLMRLDDLPTTSTGKIDRRALPAPTAPGEAIGDRAPPRTATESMLAVAFAEVLGCEQVGIDDDFFALGGHSLLATQIVTRIRTRLGVELPLRAIFDAPDVRRLAERVEDAARAARAAALTTDGQGASRLRPAAREATIPLSYAQERMWFVDQWYGGAGVYNIAYNVRVAGPLDLAALRRAFAALLERHDALRTVFRVVDGSPVQVILPSVEAPLAFVDVSGLSPEQRDAEVDRRAREHTGRSFDVATGPLLDAEVLALRPDEHVLLLTVHHIVADGWSMGVLFTDLTALYGAFAEGKPSPLAPLAVQYADFAIEQRRALSGDSLARQIAWWKNQLHDLAVLELPTDHPRPATADFRGDTVPVHYPAELVSKLGLLCQETGTTTFMALLAAFSALLHRYSGQTDIAVGTAMANRTRADTERLIGFFINTPVMRSDLSGDPSFRELLARTKKMTLDVYEWQDTPFERVVEAVCPSRDGGRHPLYQVMLTLQNMPRGTVTAGHVKMRPIDSKTGYSRHDLTFQLNETEHGLVGELEFATALFDRATAERVAGDLGRVLEAALRAPDARVSRLDYLGETERRTLVEAAAGPVTDYPDALLYELFEAQVDRTPDAEAVSSEAERVSYGELDARANRLARHLVSLGVGPEDRVAVCLTRSVALACALLATSKTGAAYVPIDASYPRDRIAYMLGDAGVRAVVTLRAISDELGLSLPHVVLLDEVDLAGTSPARLGRRGTPDGAVYVIYTSGSTGQPKGAINTHRGLVNRVLWMQGAYGLGAADVVLQKTAIGFDVAGWEVFWPLSTGARMVMARPEGQRDPRYIADVVRAERVTTIHFVPPMLQAFLEEPSAPSCTSLRRVICSGEALPGALVDRFFERMPRGVALENLYGPTEASIDVTSFACSPAAGGGTAALGRPIANTRVHVVDANLRDVPPGVWGELLLGGVQLGRGYLGRPDLTAERFVPDPFGPPGGRLYRTGDLCRFRRDGTLEYGGRIDHQVKLRGFRIELGEIEAALREQTGVLDATVLVREDVPGDRRICAYVVGAVSQEALQGALAARLPVYMLPSAYVLLPELPLTPNGKVDRRALARVRPEAAERGYVAPRTPLEELVAGVWGQVLRVERVGADDGFFDLGGHSLLATQVVSRLRELLDVELPIAALFEAQTLGPFTERVEQLLGEERGTRPPPLARREGDDPVPLSFAQERLWFLDQLSPGTATYNMPIAVRLRGEVDRAALRAAFRALSERHESLRATFASTAEGGAVQVISPEPLSELRFEDLCGKDDGEERARVRVREEALAPFDLAEGPLVRATLLRLADDEHVMSLTTHHIVSDGWSTGVLVKDLLALYDALRAGAPPSLAPITIRYSDYTVWQRSWLTGDVLDRHIAYFRERLTDVPALDLATDHPRPPVQRHRGAGVGVAFRRPLADRIAGLARAEGATLFMVVAAAFGAVLGRHAGQSRLGLGFAIAGRSRAALEGLIGFFVNTLAVPVDTTDDPTFRALVGRVRKEMLGAYAHQDAPFEKVVEAVQPERDPSRSPVFQAMIVLQNTPIEAVRRPDFALQPFGGESYAAKFDLTLTLAESSEGLSGYVEYDADLFEPATIERLVHRFETLLEGATASPDLRVSALPLVSADELAREARAGARETAVPLEAGTVHARFEERAARSPSAPAVEHEGGLLTYGELDARANQIARRLVQSGVGRGSVVAVVADRTPAMIAAVLGALKAGAAYLPLDPGYPAERVALLLADSGAALVVGSPAAIAAVVLPAGTKTLALGPDLDGEATTRPPVVTLPDELAYVIYTSGSTGTPKGVMVSHRSARNVVAALTRALDVGEASRVLQFVSLSFDVSVSEIFMALFSGATLVLARREDLLPGPELVDLLGAKRITVLSIPASALAQLPAAELPELATLVVGGEACAPETRDRWATGRLFFNAYGPTETTITATMSLCHAGDPQLTIGGPLEHVEAHVLDGAGRPAPTGVPGELFVGGVGVTRGYLGRADLTAERFVPHPFSTVPGARLYRTGDRARRTVDGAIEFLGRLDEQVKIRGFRVELGEIDSALLRHAGVAAAVSVVREDDGHRRLVSYVTTGPGATPAPKELRAHLERTLPPHMVPAAVMVLPELPRTASGKVDRRALPLPEVHESDEGFLAPTTPNERALAEIWARVLPVKKIGTSDSFFALGGDSILSIQVVTRARQAGMVFTVQDLFLHPTLGEIAGLARASGGATAEQGVLSGAFPVTPIQRWFLESGSPCPSHFNQSLLFEARQPLDDGVLRAAVRALALHHDALRVRFVREGSTWNAEYVTAPREDLFVRRDLSGVADGDVSSAVEAECAAIQASLDVTEGRVLSVAHLDLGPKRSARLLVVVHHLVVDGVSWRVLLEDLERSYGRLARRQKPDLPPKTTSLRAWSERLWQHGGAEVTRGEAPYWLAAAGASSEPLPRDTDGPNEASSIETATAVLSAEHTAALLRDVPRVQRAEVSETLLAACALAVREWTARDVVRFTMEGHGREHLGDDVDVTRTVGWFTSIYPLTLTLPDGPDLAAALRAVKEQLRGVPRKGFGFLLLRYGGGDVEARLGAARAAELSFNYLGQTEGVFGGAGFLGLAPESAGPAEGPRARRAHLLDVTAIVTGGRMKITIYYSRDVHRAATVDALAGGVVRILENLVGLPADAAAAGYTPSDFPRAKLSQSMLDKIVQRQKKKAR